MKRHLYAMFLAVLGLFPLYAAAGQQETDLLRRVDALQRTLDSLDARVAKLEAQPQNQGLLSLFEQMEALKAEVARLRGALEEQEHRVNAAEKRQKDLYVDLDGRLKELSSRPAPAQAAAQPATAQAQAEEEARAYQAAFSLIKAGNYKAAIAAYQSFLQAYPNGSLAGNAQYWIGFSNYSLADYKAAAAAHQKLLQAYPDSAKAPDAMLGLARAQVELGESAKARATLGQVVAKYPGSKAAENARKLLAVLK